ncbi:MAG: sugar kinase [Isosphaeraceae bacterium]|nr:sugar kinase [Isosphaeraceae bacterium]
MRRTTEVYGPAYLDRVLRVDRPLHAPGGGPPLDQSVDGRGEFTENAGSALRLCDPEGGQLTIALPDGWPGPRGTVWLNRPLTPGSPPCHRGATGVDWHDDLGGMGAGFAVALGGRLVSVLGPERDATSRTVAALLARFGVAHRPIRVAGQTADWTLLVTSGPFGDKLPVGFRGCHAALESLPPDGFPPCDLRVVSSLPNRLAAQALRAPGASVRVFAPSLRNMLDRTPPVSEFAGAIDVLCCNRREWNTLDDREEVAWRVAFLAVTDGPDGSTVRFTTPEGEPGSYHVNAFPRSRPPRDTNRAGEAYASTLVGTLLDHGWSSGVTDPALARHAAVRASAAAALELDMREFGFPAPDAIDAAVRAGCVA